MKPQFFTKEVNGKSVTLCFYKKEENTHLSFAVMQSDKEDFTPEFIDKLLTDKLLSLCNVKTTKKEGVRTAARGLFDKLKSIVAGPKHKVALLYNVMLKNGSMYSNKTKKEVYSLIYAQKLTEDEVSYISPLSRHLKNKNIKPFFFSKGKRFKIGQFEKIKK